MARVTIEDCLNEVGNRFALIHLAAKRVRQLRKDDEPLVVCKNTDTVVALREIAAGKIYQVKKEKKSHKLEHIKEITNQELIEQTEDIAPNQEEKSEEPTPEDN